MGCVETMDKKELTKLISALVMSDGGVYYSGKNCRYVRNQLAKHWDYLSWIRDVLSNVTTTTISEVKDKREGRQPTLNVTTRSHPMFNDIRERFYVGNYKSVDPHFLKMFDWQCAAILYMDDGHLRTDPRSPNYFTCDLSTKRLSYGDSLLLKKTIKEKLDVEFNVRKDSRGYYYLTLRRKDAEKFLKGVYPYTFASFKYKFTYPDGKPVTDFNSGGGDIVRPSWQHEDSERNLAA